MGSFARRLPAPSYSRETKKGTHNVSVLACEGFSARCIGKFILPGRLPTVSQFSGRDGCFRRQSTKCRGFWECGPLSNSGLVKAPDVTLLCGKSSHWAAAVFSYKGDDAAVTKDVAAGYACSAFPREVTKRADARILKTPHLGDSNY